MYDQAMTLESAFNFQKNMLRSIDLRIDIDTLIKYVKIGLKEEHDCILNVGIFNSFSCPNKLRNKKIQEKIGMS